jgi:uncharacterized protein YbjT (DUF2867 family)
MKKQTMKNRTALVFGATGLVGSLVAEELVKLETYNKIVLFSRREIRLYHDKLHLVQDTLESLNNITGKIKGDDLFCCLGTTMKKAGSRDVFKKANLELPSGIAEQASKNGVKNFIVVSSIGAGPSSKKNFYLRVKGEMEEAVLKYPFEHAAIVRPSLLIGPRKEFRLGETVAKVITPVVDPLLRGKLKKYRSIHARDVAKAMISLALFPRKKVIFESDELKEISNSFTLGSL